MKNDEKPFPAEFEGAAFSNSLYDSLLSILLSLLLSVLVHEKHTAERGMSIAAMIVFIFCSLFLHRLFKLLSFKPRTVQKYRPFCVTLTEIVYYRPFKRFIIYNDPSSAVHDTDIIIGSICILSDSRAHNNLSIRVDKLDFRIGSYASENLGISA